MWLCSKSPLFRSSKPANIEPVAAADSGKRKATDRVWDERKHTVRGMNEEPVDCRDFGMREAPTDRNSIEWDDFQSRVEKWWTRHGLER